METKCYLKYPCLVGHYNTYVKYGLVRVYGYLKDQYGKLFNNFHWHVLTNSPIPEGNTAPAQGTDNNGNPRRSD